MLASQEKTAQRAPVDPYTAYELPALASRAIAHAYVATAIGMPLLFVLEWIARRSGFADDELGDAAARCLIPAGVALAFALASRRFEVARHFAFAQGFSLMVAITVVLALSASATGGIWSPYLISLQTMLYLWGLIMPGGIRRALAPVVASPLLFFGVLAATGAPVFADSRAVVAVLFTGTSASLSLAYAQVLERRRRAVWTASSIDSLSGLFNRRYLLERFEALQAKTREARLPLSVLLFDIDEFKRINDTHGHAAGDEVIRAVASILSNSTRATDLSGRLGGEEFVLVLDDTDHDVALAVGERIRASVEAAHIETAEGAVHVTLSVGITSQPADEGRSIDALLREADDALYRSKRAGRNRVTMFAA
jgi:diguanylate cyclase (GGDEF)-like protein